MHPTARTTDITVKRIGDEAVLFDAATGSIHHLNRVAEIVWRSCDGRTDRASLERIVARITNVIDAGPAVELALEQLSSRGLLETKVVRASADRRRNRRQALKQLAAAAAIPIIMTCTAGRARAQSNSPGQQCTITCQASAALGGTRISVTGTFGTNGDCEATCPSGYVRVS